MGIKIREMQKSETQEVMKLGKKAFTAFESLWVSSPKTALVAVSEDKIVGAMLYKFIKSGSKKIGYIDYVFTDPDKHGTGIGKVLFEEAASYMWEQGCDALTALVKDDNVASWGLFQKNGFSRISIPNLVREFGVMGTLQQYFAVPYFIAIGMDYYVALPGRSCPSGKNNSGLQMLMYLLGNLGLICISLVLATNPINLFLACGIVLCVEVATGFLGTLLSKRKWKFRLTNGGAVVSLLVNIPTFMPMIGRWYPTQYEKTPEFKRDMGINALVSWIGMLALSAIILLACPQSAGVLRYVGQLALALSAYRCIPLYPVEGFGGKRVFDWNKAVFFVMAAATLILFCINAFL